MKIDHIPFFEEAGKIAEQALCLRDKCGIVVVLKNEIIASGYKTPRLKMTLRVENVSSNSKTRTNQNLIEPVVFMQNGEQL